MRLARRMNTEEPLVPTAKGDAATESREEATAPADETPREVPEPEQETKQPLKPKARVVNSRLTRYRNAVEELANKYKNNTVAAKAKRFIQDPDPSADRVSELLNEMLEQKAEKKAKENPLPKKQQFVLAQNCLCYYLDKLCFEEKTFEQLTALRAPLGKLKKARINLLAIYQYWEAAEVEKYEKDVPLDTIEELFT